MFDLPTNFVNYVHISIPLAKVYGTDLSGIQLSSEFRRTIVQFIDNGYNVEVNFEGVRTVTNGWTRNVFGILIHEKGDNYFMKHIKLSNMSDYIRITVLEGISEVNNYYAKKRKKSYEKN